MDNFSQQGTSRANSGFQGQPQGQPFQGNDPYRFQQQQGGMQHMQQMGGPRFDLPPEMLGPQAQQQRMQQMQGMYPPANSMPSLQFDQEGRPLNPNTGRPFTPGDPEDELVLNILAAKRQREQGGDRGVPPPQFSQFRPQMHPHMGMNMNIPAMQAMQHPGMRPFFADAMPPGQMQNERLEPGRFGLPSRPMDMHGYYQMDQQNQKKKRMHKKKPVDMPRRPLSAYNLFFSEERERILKEIDEKEGKTSEDAADEAKKEIKEDDAGEEDEEEGDDKKKPKALLRPMVPSQKKRRPHRKTHGKISFQQLARMVGERWKALDDEKRKYYKELAQEDMKRQKEAMEEYYAKQNSLKDESKDPSMMGHLHPEGV